MDRMWKNWLIRMRKKNREEEGKKEEKKGKRNKKIRKETER